MEKGRRSLFLHKVKIYVKTVDMQLCVWKYHADTHVQITRRDMMQYKKEDVEELRSKARTFHGMIPPNGAVKVAEEERRGELFEYYRDLSGKIWYETTTGREWKLKIAKWEKERQKKKH